MKIINRNENIHIIDYLYNMNIYFSNKYKNAERKIKILSVIMIINFYVYF